jgi:hypothetical protein
MISIRIYGFASQKRKIIFATNPITRLIKQKNWLAIAFEHQKHGASKEPSAISSSTGTSKVPGHLPYPDTAPARTQKPRHLWTRGALS